ncbi:hypothetical protein N7466_001435 [Penicillium verhagenii]|uniref:uncharacterized protein n=1 Tax=Penicillium verhagenii TaxID=1562060 RepID=UPI002545A6DB|nr:uncharacterized protein N7466_001435 [Penicillium verhagenii]KAJ5938301.1 hypothetical protein N7466_001435 [Penicillium verhagenii]
MSGIERRAALESKFPSLKAYHDDLKGLSTVLEDNKNIGFDADIAERIEQWMLKRRGNAFTSMVTSDRPAYILDQSRFKYHTAVDIDRKEVIQACDVNGVAVHSREQTIRDLSDTDTIARVNASDSNPFLKARFVLDNPDADRLIDMIAGR